MHDPDSFQVRPHRLLCGLARCFGLDAANLHGESETWYEPAAVVVWMGFELQAPLQVVLVNRRGAEQEAARKRGKTFWLVETCWKDLETERTSLCAGRLIGRWNLGLSIFSRNVWAFLDPKIGIKKGFGRCED